MRVALRRLSVGKWPQGSALLLLAALCFQGAGCKGGNPAGNVNEADGALPGQDGTLPGQDGTLPGQDGTLPGQDGTLPGQDGTLPGPDASQTGDQASFVSQSFPSSLAAGETFSAQFVMQNTGSTTWSIGEGYKLGSQSPEDNMTWGTLRLLIPDGVTVSPGQSHTFQATLTAPTTSGSYTMHWRMVRELVQWFGEATQPVSIQVGACDPNCVGVICGQSDGCGGTCHLGSGCVVSDATIIYPYSGLGWYSHIAVSSPSRVMLVWAERSAFRGIMYSCFNGTSWTSPQRVEPANNELQDDPSLVAGSDGVFHLVFSHAQGTGRHIKYARFEGACDQAWTASQVVSDTESVGRNSNYPSVGVDENGRPHVTWSQAVTTDGQGEYEQHYSRRDPGGWINPSMRITPANLDVGHSHRLAHHGRVYVENSSNVHAIFLLPIGDINDRSQYYSHFNGTSWSMPEDTGVDGHFGDVRVDADRIHVFSCYGEYRSRLRTGGSWLNYAKLLSDWQAGKMALRMDGSGRLHAAWTDYNRVYYAVKDPHPASWQTPKRVSTNTDTHSSPTLDIDSAGYTHIAWHERENSSTDEYGAILYRKVRYQDL